MRHGVSLAFLLSFDALIVCCQLSVHQLLFKVSTVEKSCHARYQDLIVLRNQLKPPCAAAIRRACWWLQLTALITYTPEKAPKGKNYGSPYVVEQCTVKFGPCSKDFLVFGVDPLFSISFCFIQIFWTTQSPTPICLSTDSTKPCFFDYCTFCWIFGFVHTVLMREARIVLPHFLIESMQKNNTNRLVLIAGNTRSICHSCRLLQ